MTQDLITLSVELAKAHLTQNRMSHRDVPEFIRNLHSTLASLSTAAAPAALAATTSEAPETPAPALAASAPASPAIAAEAEAPATQVETEVATADAGAPPTSRHAPVLHEDIDDPVYNGLDPWLARRISPRLASKLDPSNAIHPSVFPDHLICLEDGEKVKLLRSYVQKRFGLSFSEYVDKWNLPDDYPTAPPSYLEAKRATAKASGLGTTLRANRERKPAAAASPSKSTRTKASSAKAATATKSSGRGRKASEAPAPTARGARGQRRHQPLMPAQ